MELVVRTQKELSKKFIQYAAKRSRTLSKTLRIIIRNKDAEAVHEFRKATRDLQCLIDACRVRRSTRRAKRIRSHLQSWRHGLSDWRDSDVMIKLVEQAQRKAHHLYERKAWPAIAEKTVKTRQRALKQFRKNADLLPNIRKLRTKIKELVKSRAKTEHLADNLAQLLQQAWQKLSVAIDEFERVPEVANLHAVRIKTKSLRYALDLRQRFYPNRKLEDSSALLKEIQDRIGAWHDELMLSELVRSTLSNFQPISDPNAAKITEGIKEREIAMAESARHYLLAMQETEQYKRLRRVISAAIYATSKDEDAEAAAHQNAIGPSN
jgi:CHAD domain-containing protein